jgi:diguanylate cyclase (GGDEF)-like protein/PAS domain S-box-containing protein
MSSDASLSEISAEPDQHSWLVLLGLRSARAFHEADVLEGKLAAMPWLWPIMWLVLAPSVAISGLFMDHQLICGVMLTIPALGWQIGRMSLAPVLKVRLQTIFALLLGGNIGLLLASSAGNPDIITILGTLGLAAVVGAGVMAALPAALMAFALGITAMIFASYIDWRVPVVSLLMLIALGAAACFVAKEDARQGLLRWLNNRDARRANRLLQEVEQNSTGWFWESDRAGNLTYISPKIALELTGLEDGLIGSSVSSIFVPDEEKEIKGDAPGSERPLRFYLTNRSSFSELPVRAADGKGDRWWSISGRPVMDRYGQFRGFIGSGTDLTEQKRADAEVSRLARFDPLTGLANRAETAVILRRALAGFQGRVRPAALMIIDLDRFKAVNDTMGHPVGDELLKQVAARLRQAVGSMGDVGRLGGDEFKVVLPGLDDAKQLNSLAATIIESLSCVYRIQGSDVSIGASIGIAIAPDHGATPDDLVRNADLALYAAKDAGRGVARFYEPGMHSSAELKRQIETDMREAYKNGDFRLVYQPIVALAEERIVGFEALIRWNHPTKGAISPADFIPLAEECGLIEQIGEWTLRTAAAEAANWAVEARVAVNVSAIQFANPGFPNLVANVLAQSGLAPDRLEIEITEGVFVSEGAHTDRQFALLKKLGVRLALDDFGTGYSSLGYLRRAPFDKIKIDQSFVRGASLGQDRNAAIIKAIVTLAETMQLETTAEGVETQDEIDFIRQIGCSHIQGFVYGKPIEAATLVERLGTRGTEAERVGHRHARSQRLRVIRIATLTVNGNGHRVRMRNISNTGTMIEGPSWLPPGTAVSIDIMDGVIVHGCVRWIDDGKIGIGFDYPVELTKPTTASQRSA